MLDRLPGAIGLFDILLASWEPRRIYDATTNGNVCEARREGMGEGHKCLQLLHDGELLLSISLSFTALSFRRLLLGFLLLADLPSYALEYVADLKKMVFSKERSEKKSDWNFS